ncbi:MAG TPA: VOC family protein [Longimicrobium sp.]|jgi:catechol 2,3-dioxygenase-like lactoylglutathione lyase family enzyme
MSGIVGLDHVQLAMPRGGEERARAFYAGVLGMAEVPKPAALVPRGGAWFAAGAAEVHLGVEDDFRPARKAHPALLVGSLGAVLEACRAAGCAIVDAEPLEGREHAYVSDPFGNRIELIQWHDG